VHSATEGIVATPRWITALACVPYSDLLASGKCDRAMYLFIKGSGTAECFSLFAVQVRGKGPFVSGRSIPTLGIEVYRS
jgi:ribosomal RNA-processing protein 9